jgi:hypothetical protein
LLPAGAIAGWDFHPLESAAFCTAHARSGHSCESVFAQTSALNYHREFAIPPLRQPPLAVAALRGTLKGISLVLFFPRGTTSALQIAEHLLAQAATGERDLDRLKASALNKLVSQ